MTKNKHIINTAIYDYFESNKKETFAALDIDGKQKTKNPEKNLNGFKQHISDPSIRSFVYETYKKKR